MKLLVSTLILIVFVTIGGFGMFVVTGMDGHHHEAECPFMLGEQAVCAMTVLDHILAWQRVFTVTFPAMFIYLLGAAVTCVWKYYCLPDFFVRKLPLRRSEDYVSISSYQELFSNGILNPKAP